jgi:delta-aminolevulinic acid dehydratase/porphobilinogen synthase
MMTMAKVTICRYSVCGTAAAGCATGDVTRGATVRVTRRAVVVRCRLRKTFFAPARSDGILLALFDMLIPSAIHVPGGFARELSALRNGSLQNDHVSFNSTQSAARFGAPDIRVPSDSCVFT